MKTKRTFTLLETILAITIIIMIVGTVYAFYHYSAKIAQSGKEKIEQVQLARMLLAKIADEIRAITPAGKSFTTILDGKADEITFITVVVPSRIIFFPSKITDSSRSIEHDFRRIKYSLARSEEDENKILGFRRDELRCLLTPLIKQKKSEELTEEEIESQRQEQQKFQIDFDIGINQAFTDQPVILQQLISEKIKYLRFDYYDGKTWHNRWNSADGADLPRAILITIGFTEMSQELWEDQLTLSPNQREFRDDDYSIFVPLVLSDELHSANKQQRE